MHILYDKKRLFFSLDRNNTHNIFLVGSFSTYVHYICNIFFQLNVSSIHLITANFGFENNFPILIAN